MLPLMWIALVMTAGVSIFGISFQVDFAKEVGFGPLVAASSMGIMAVINGIGRAVVGWLSGHAGPQAHPGVRASSSWVSPSSA